jgi:maleylpyruvate isomerase
MIKLYNYYRSSASFRVRIALNLKKLPYEFIPIHLLNSGGEQFSIDYLTVNPQGLVPTLEDGDKNINQSLAIIEYLDETHPNPPLLPNDPFHKALARSFALEIAADIHPLNNLRVLTFLTHELGISEEKKTQWYQHWIHQGLAALEKRVVTTKMSGDFCLGNSITIADICLVPQLYNARRFSCDLSAYPTLVSIDERCQNHPAFIEAWPQES